MNVFWAHVDAAGRIQKWGQSIGSDVFLQPLADGLTAVARPADITGYDKVRYVEGQWIKEESAP